MDQKQNQYPLSWATIGMLLVCRICVAAAPNGPANGTASRPGPLLDPVEYVDETFGFALHPPAGAQRVAEQFYDPASPTIALVTFRNSPLLAGELVVQLWTWPEPTTVDQIVKRLRVPLILELPAEAPPKFEPSGKSLTVAGRPALRFDARYRRDGRDWHRQYLALALSDRMFLAFIYTDLTVREATAQKLFGRIMASIRLLDQRAGVDQLQHALDRGAVLVSKLSETDLKPLLVPEQWFLFEDAADRAVGYLHVREGEGREKDIEGIAIREDGFIKLTRQGGGEVTGASARPPAKLGIAIVPMDDIRMIRNRFFVSGDQLYESWSQEVRWLAVPQQAPVNNSKAWLIRDHIRGIRVGSGLDDSQLLVSYTEFPGDAKLVDAPTIRPPPYYMPEATFRLLPRTLDLRKPAIYGVASFARSNNGLVTRMLRIVGPEQITIGGRDYQATRIEDRKGLVGNARTLWVDGKGRLLRTQAGKKGVVMRISTKKEVQSRAVPLLSKAYQTLIAQSEAQ